MNASGRVINLTKRKKSDHGQQSPFELALYRLRVIAFKIEAEIPLDLSERVFLINAFRKIGAGGDAKEALQIKGERGRGRSSKSKFHEERRDFVLSWVAAAIRPEPEGFGYDLLEAIDIAANWKYSEAAGLTAETILNYWNNHPEKHKSNFDRPIRSLP